MSDQAAGLRAWQRKRDANQREASRRDAGQEWHEEGRQRGEGWPLLILGEPDPAALRQALTRLEARLGRRFRPVPLDRAADTMPQLALLWIEASRLEATREYRWLKRMATSVGPLSTLVCLDGGEDAQQRTQLNNLGVTARRFLGVRLSRDPGAWFEGTD